jgi:hypothetical protein
MGAMRNVYKILVGKSEGKGPLGRPRRRLQVNIRMGLKEIGRKGVDWIHLFQDRDWWWAVVNVEMKFWVHSMERSLS